MYTLVAADFVSRKVSRRVSFRSAPGLLSHPVFSQSGADRFFVGWLFLHRRLRFRQRRSVRLRATSDFCSLPGGSLPKSVDRFYPSDTEVVFQRLREQSLSASVQGVIATNSVFRCPHDDASPRRPPFPESVSGPWAF